MWVSLREVLSSRGGNPYNSGTFLARIATGVYDKATPGFRDSFAAHWEFVLPRELGTYALLKLRALSTERRYPHDRQIVASIDLENSISVIILH